MKSLKKIIIFAAILFPFYISVRDIAIDSIPFWFDPARDLLSAWDNLHKITLIGPPSGVPGIFYGPYWIWFLSIGLLFSRDPRVITALVLTIPYFTLFPFVLFRFGKIFGSRITIIIWLLFIFAYKQYSTYLWNPHLAPLFILITVYFLIFTDFKKQKFRSCLKIFLAGISAGLLVNIHISFGMIIILAALVFLVVEYRKLFFLLLFNLGLLLSFIPNIIFEIRHGFHQTQAIISTVSTAFLSHATVTGVSGLTKIDIVNEFFNSLSKLLRAPLNVTYVVCLLVAAHIIIKRKSYFSGQSKFVKRLWLFLFLSTFFLFAVYLTSKNPVWSYHFIGVEVIFMLALGLVLTKFHLLKNILAVWVIILSFYYAYLLTLPSEIPLFKVDNLATKKHIVDIIYKDINNTPFAVFAYSAAIYTYDYDYLFRWYGNDKYPGQMPKKLAQVNYAFLIIPSVSEPIRLDFINYRTPNEDFRTIKEWQINNGATILKREHTLQ